MRCLEIVCVTTSASERAAAIDAVAPFCVEADVDVRIYRHETHPTDLAVHLTYPVEVSGHAVALGERIADLLKTHGFLSRARWREVATRDGAVATSTAPETGASR